VVYDLPAEARVFETTLDIRFSHDEAHASVESNVAGELEQQAELISFAHYAARLVLSVGPGRAFSIAESLTRLEDATTEQLADLAGRDWPVRSESSAPHVATRFLSSRGGPRMFFRLKQPGLPHLGGGDAQQDLGTVHALLSALLSRWASDVTYVRRLAITAGSIGRLAASGQIRPDNEFDVSLASADVAWHLGVDHELSGVLPWNEELNCPACGGTDLEFRLWPSARSAIRRCGGCGSGLWLRARRRPRLLRAETWRAMETIRDEIRGLLAGSMWNDKLVSEAGEGRALVEELKRVFVENGWPFTEVRGAPVLLSELSGDLGRWKFYAQVVEAHGLVLLYSVCPLRVPEERRDEVSRFLTLANYGLAAGNFELDFEDGEIRYKTVLQLQGDQLDGITLKRLVRANGIAMETYLPGIGAVITGTPALPAFERRTNG
jgi:hypothetical protein